MSEYSLLASRPLVAFNTIYDYGGGSHPRATVVALPDGTYFVAVSWLLMNQSEHLQVWRLDSALEVLGTIDLPVAAFVNQQHPKMPLAYVHDGMKVVLHAQDIYGDVDRETWMIDCAPLTPVVVDHSLTPPPGPPDPDYGQNLWSEWGDRDEYLKAIPCKVGNGMALIGSNTAMECWDGVTLVDTISFGRFAYFPTFGTAMLWPNPDNSMEVAVNFPNVYKVITVSATGQLSWAEHTSPWPQMDWGWNMCAFGSPYDPRGITVLDGDGASITLVEYAHPETTVATASMPDLGERYVNWWSEACLADGRFVSWQSVMDNNYKGGVEHARLLGVDPVAGTLERLQLPYDPTFQGKNAGSPGVQWVTVNADPTTGRIVACATIGDGWGYGMQMWSIQGPPAAPLPASGLTGALNVRRVRFV